MFSKHDIEFIKESRDQIRKNRTKEVTIYSEILLGKHPISGEDLIEKRTDVVQAVVTVVSVRTINDRYLDDGVLIHTGDIIVDISLEDLPEGVSSNDIISVNYDGKLYTVVASPKLGLGGYNRIELIGRLEK